MNISLHFNQLLLLKYKRDISLKNTLIWSRCLPWIPSILMTSYTQEVLWWFVQIILFSYTNKHMNWLLLTLYSIIVVSVTILPHKVEVWLNFILINSPSIKIICQHSSGNKIIFLYISESVGPSVSFLEIF